MDEIVISEYLHKAQSSTKYGFCKACNRKVGWSKVKIGAHNRASCPDISEDEKRKFAKRKTETRFLLDDDGDDYDHHDDNDVIQNINIIDYLDKVKFTTKYGICKVCDKNVGWSRKRVASHKRKSCLHAGEHEKRIFGKRSAAQSKEVCSDDEVDKNARGAFINAISEYLYKKDAKLNRGFCKFCNKKVRWSKERIAQHMRSSCPEASEDEKRKFAVRKSLMSCSDDQDDSNAKDDTDECHKEANQRLKTLFVEKQIPFEIVESVEFIRFINFLNPSYAIPSTKTLFGRDSYQQCLTLCQTVIKEEEFMYSTESEDNTIDFLMNDPLCDVQEDSDYSSKFKEILESEENVMLLSTGWSNLKEDKNVNFSIKTAKNESHFVTSITTADIEQNASIIADTIIKVLEDLGPQKFSRVITDNAPNIKDAWKLIEQKYPHISAYGCAVDAVNHLIQDLLSTEHARSIKETEIVSKFIKKHKKIKKTFDESETSRICLATSAHNKWNSLFSALNRLQNIKYVLIKVLDEEYGEMESEEISAESSLIKSSQFWDRLRNLIKDIEYLLEVKKKLEANQVPLASIYCYFGEMYEKFKDKKQIQEIVKRHFNSIYSPCMGLSYILTPKFAAEGFYFVKFEKIDILSSSTEFAAKDGSNFEDIEQEFYKFIGEMIELVPKRKETLFKMTAKQYWYIIGREKYPMIFKTFKSII